MRLHGRLQPLLEVDSHDGYETALLAILTESQRQIFAARNDLDFAYPEFEDHSTRIVGPHGKSKRYTMVV